MKGLHAAMKVLHAAMKGLHAAMKVLHAATKAQCGQINKQFFKIVGCSAW